MSRDSIFNARFGALPSGIGSYPSRTVSGMYQQEQKIAKAEEAGLIVTAADLADAYPICENCGERLDSEFSTCKPCNKRYLCK